MEDTIRNAVQQRSGSQSQVDSVEAMIRKSESQIKMALPNDYDPARFTRIALSIYKSDERLRQCTPLSFLSALMTSAQLGLEPNTPMGYAYIIPYKNQASFQLGYQGLMNLMYRSPKTSLFYASEVRDTDEYYFEKGTNPQIHHRINIKNRGEVIAYYAVYKNTSGMSVFEVMSREEVVEHKKKYSKANYSQAWASSFDSMAMKTVALKTLKFVPKDVEITKIMSLDEKVRTEISKDMTEIPGSNIIDVDPQEEVVEVVSEAKP